MTKMSKAERARREQEADEARIRAALRRGEPLPASPKQAIEAENRRSLARLLGGQP